MKVPYLDLKAQYHSIKPEIDAAISRVLESCQFVLGPEVAGFEQEFAAGFVPSSIATLSAKKTTGGFQRLNWLKQRVRWKI